MKRLLPLAVVLVLAAGCGGSRQVSGCTLVLRALPGNGQPVTSAGMQIAANIISGRLSGGASSPAVSASGDEITIESAGRSFTPTRASLVVDAGRLEFFDFEKALAPPTVANGIPAPYPTLYSLLTAVNGAARGGTPDGYYLFSSRKTVLAGPAATSKELLAAYGGKLPPGGTILAVPPNREVVSGPIETPATKPVGEAAKDGVYWYLFKLPAALSGRDVRESTVEADTGEDGQPELRFTFTRRGARAFQRITRAEYDRGLVVAGLAGSPTTFNERYAQHNAIVLDGRIQAAPFIDYSDATLSLGIAGGSAVIQDIPSTQAANNLALVLHTGSLPYTLQRVSAQNCSR